MKSSDVLKIENLSNTSEVFTIRWRITYLCNYNCDFCIQGNREKHNEKCKQESYEIRKKICDNIIKLIETKVNKKYKAVYIYLIGGEISVLKDFIEVLEKFLNCKFEGTLKIHINTNLSADNAMLENISELMNKKYDYERYLTITASYYKEYVTEEEFMKKIGILYQKENKVNKLLKKLKNKDSQLLQQNFKGKIYVNVVYPLCEDDDYKNYLKFKRKYKGKAKIINYIVIRDYKKSISDKLKKKLTKSKPQKKLLKVTTINNNVFHLSNMNKLSLRLENENNFNPKGYLCDIGINSINISNLGIASRCMICTKETFIEDLKENTISKLPTEKLICTQNKCNCSFYGIIEKNI